MREFGSLGEVGLFLAEAVVHERKSLEEGLLKALLKIEKTAKAEFGQYQAEVGGFPAWPELAESTKEDRARHGYTENDPLLRSGELRDSIGHEIDRAGLEGGVGSTDDKMVFHEFGTSKMPARPALGPAAFRNKDTIQKLVGAAAAAGLIGKDRVHEALGYDFETEADG